MSELDPKLAEEILAAVDAGFEDQIAFTQELVRHPSLRGREHTAQDVLYSEFRARGYALDRWAIDLEALRDHPGFSPVEVDYANAINVVATHRPTHETGRSLILNGHIDVVPAEPAEWSSDPFEPEWDGHRVTARGAADMKSGLVSCVFAARHLAELAAGADGPDLNGRVVVEGVAGEEAGGRGPGRFLLGPETVVLHLVAGPVPAVLVAPLVQPAEEAAGFLVVPGGFEGEDEFGGLGHGYPGLVGHASTAQALFHEGVPAVAHP